MFDKCSRLFSAPAVTALIVFSIALPEAYAAGPSKGRIICWKDASGKIVGCGDRVPPEYQESATKELDRRGVTRRTTETAEEAERRKLEEQELAKKRADEKRRLAERQRQDRALLATYSNEREIDDRRDREIEVVEAQMRQLEVALKNVSERRSDIEVRRNAAEKNEQLKESLPTLQRELESTTAEQRRLEQRITTREKDIADIRSRFQEQKQRYRMLTGGASASTAPAKPH